MKIEDVQVYDCGGKTSFSKRFPTKVCKDEFFKYHVKTYAVIHDADNGANDSFKSIQHYLKENKQPVPKRIGEFHQEGDKKVGVFILPGFKTTGMLEDLYLETIKGSKLLEHVENCFEAIKNDYPEKTKTVEFAICKNAAKAKALGTWMATEDPCNALGLTAQAGYWNFDHPAMKDLISFLENFRDN